MSVPTKYRVVNYDLRWNIKYIVSLLFLKPNSFITEIPKMWSVTGKIVKDFGAQITVEKIWVK